MLELEPNLGEEQLMEIVEEVDEDGSGTIDFDGNICRISFLLPTIAQYRCDCSVRPQVYSVRPPMLMLYLCCENWI